MKKFWLSFMFYFGENLKKGSLILYGVMLAGTVGLIWAATTFGGQPTDVAIVNEAGLAIPGMIFEELPGVEAQFLETEAAAMEQFEAGYVSEVFIVRDTFTLETIGGQFNASPMVEGVLTQIMMAQHLGAVASEHDLADEVVAELMQQINVTWDSGDGGDVEDAFSGFILGMIVRWGTYGVVLMLGQMLANAVVSDKMSRVMELMLGKVHPTVTMLARALSVTMGLVMTLGSVVIGLVIAEVLGFMSIGELLSMLTDMISLEAAVFAGVVFFLGVFIYLFLFAAVGAMASSIETLGKLMTPLIFAVLIPTMVPDFVSPDQLLYQILQYIPLFSPFLVINSFLGGYIEMWQAGLIVGIMAIFAVVVLKGAARIYMNGVSQTSEKIRFSDFKKLLAK